MTEIKDATFDGCISLTSIQFPVGLNSIGANAFQGCALTELSFPDSLVNIGQSAFSDCDAIVSLTVNASLNLALASFSICDRSRMFILMVIIFMATAVVYFQAQVCLMRYLF